MVLYDFVTFNRRTALKVMAALVHKIMTIVRWVHFNCGRVV